MKPAEGCRVGCFEGLADGCLDGWLDGCVDGPRNNNIYLNKNTKIYMFLLPYDIHIDCNMFMESTKKTIIIT